MKTKTPCAQTTIICFRADLVGMEILDREVGKLAKTLKRQAVGLRSQVINRAIRRLGK